MSDHPANFSNEKAGAITWLRDVLSSAISIVPLSYQQRKVTSRFLNDLPDWLIARWADALDIDYIGGSRVCLNMAELVTSDKGRRIAREYVESHNAVPTATALGNLTKWVVQRTRENSLPPDLDTIVEQVCALSLADNTADGIKFAETAQDVLNDPDRCNHPLVDYQISVMSGDNSKLVKLDSALAGSQYGMWVSHRLTEMKRYLGLEPPHFTVHYGERTPQWDTLWKNVLTGGDET